MSYYFIEDKDNKKERRVVAFKLHMTMFIFGIVVGMICSMLSPMNKTRELSVVMSILFNFMWIPFFWGVMFTGFMVKPPKKSRFFYKLPEKANYILWIVAIVLILIDILVFGPGITINS